MIRYNLYKSNQNLIDSVAPVVSTTIADTHTDVGTGTSDNAMNAKIGQPQPRPSGWMNFDESVSIDGCQRKGRVDREKGGTKDNQRMAIKRDKLGKTMREKTERENRERRTRCLCK